MSRMGELTELVKRHYTNVSEGHIERDRGVVSADIVHISDCSGHVWMQDRSSLNDGSSRCRLKRQIRCCLQGLLHLMRSPLLMQLLMEPLLLQQV